MQIAFRKISHVRHAVEIAREDGERMCQLVGRWKATAYGEAMELEWPSPG